MVEFTGACLCGAVKYKVNGDIVRTANCHCDDCRRATGSSFATNVFFSRDAIEITEGEAKQFQHQADSGNTMTKHFCANCGSQLFGNSSRSPDIRSVKVGSIDDASFVEPDIALFTDRALHFSHISGQTKNFPGMPDG